MNKNITAAILFVGLTISATYFLTENNPPPTEGPETSNASQAQETSSLTLPRSSEVGPENIESPQKLRANEKSAIEIAEEIKKQYEPLAETELELHLPVRTRIGLRSQLKAQGVPLFFSPIVFQKTTEGSWKAAQELPQSNNFDKRFPDIQPSLALESAQEIFDSMRDCQAHGIGKERSYWYEKPKGNWLPVIALPVSFSCTGTRDRLSELWMFETEDYRRIGKERNRR